MPDNHFIQRQLANGLSICLEPLPHVPSAACGFLVRTGARDEAPQEEGVSHFLEHICFKGTAKRTWQDITETFDRLGSTYNAFTCEEKTFYYGWVPAENLLPQIELLADMMRSVIPPAEFDTEKKVILEEIAQYRDSLEACMIDLARRHLYGSAPLSRSVLGTEATIEPLTREQMLAYHARRYGPENMIFIAAGKLDPGPVIAHLEALTADWPSGQGGRQPQPMRIKTGLAKQKNDKFTQQAIMLCYPAPAGNVYDPRIGVLNGILSGENSRFYWEIIQKGLCPRAGMYHLDFSDTGVLVLAALCVPEKADAVYAALREQADKIAREGPVAFEVERVKNQTRTGIARDGDAPSHRLHQLVDDLDLLGHPLSLEEHLARIAAVQVPDVRAFLEEYPLTGDGFLVSVGPHDWPK